MENSLINGRAAQREKTLADGGDYSPVKAKVNDCLLDCEVAPASTPKDRLFDIPKSEGPHVLI